MKIIIAILASLVIGAIAYRRWRAFRRLNKRLDHYVRRQLTGLSNWVRAWRTEPPIILEGYVRDDTLDYCVRDFERRARSWKRTANLSFAFSLASVVVGICIFIFADRIAVDNPELQRLTDRRDDLERSVQTGLEQMDAGERELVIASNLYRDWLVLRSIINRFSAERFRDPTSESLKDIRTRLPLLSDELREIKATLQDLGMSEANRTSLYSATDLAAFEQQLQEQQISLLDLSGFFDDYFSLLESEAEVIADDEWLKTTVASLAKSAANLRPAAESINTSLQQREKAARELENKNAASDVFALRQSQSELREVNSQIAAYTQQQFDPKNLYSVVPLLVVRLGAVVLLIFLTQILLAAYRYNTMLYTHYASIADALRIVPGKENGKGPNYELFERLTKTLYAKDTSYAPPESPIPYIAGLAKRTE